MSVKVGKLYRDKIVRDLDGNIRDWFDEAHGGWIVKDYVVVNKDAWESYQTKLKDQAEAAKAISLQKIDPDAPDRTKTPGETKDAPEVKQSEIDAVKKEMSEFKADVNDKFSQILSALGSISKQ